MVSIVGLGPGHESYILPIAIEAIKKADLVIGAKRHIDSIRPYCSVTMDYSNGFDVVKDRLIKHQVHENIVVAVSGDVGFHSMLAFVKRHVEESLITVIPGISSLQYLYSKLGFGYEDSKWISLHGREFDLEDAIIRRQELGILLDKNQNNQFVANEYKKMKALLVRRNDHEDEKELFFYVGERLSYDDECIHRFNIDECINYKAEDLSVVIVRYE